MVSRGCWSSLRSGSGRQAPSRPPPSTRETRRTAGSWKMRELEIDNYNCRSSWQREGKSAFPNMPEITVKGLRGTFAAGLHRARTGKHVSTGSIQEGCSGRTLCCSRQPGPCCCCVLHCVAWRRMVG